MTDTLTVDNWALTKVTLDYANQFMPDMFIANANDISGRGIDLYITKDGTAMDMTGMNVYLAWRHENGNQDLTMFSAVSSASGHFKVYYPNAMMRGGTVLARIAVYVGTSTPITGSRDFRLVVEENPIDDEAAMADESFTAFQQAVIDLNSLAESVSDAEAARVSAEKARVSAENTRVSNENTRKDNESTRIENENARVSAESARATAEGKRVSAETARANAETSRVNAESSRVSAEKARVTAEEQRVSEFAVIKANAQSATNAANGAASNANAAASTALQIANSVAQGAAGDSDIADLKQQLSSLGSMVADLRGEFYYLDGTVYAPASKASRSGTTVTLSSTCTASGTAITLA